MTTQEMTSKKDFVLAYGLGREDYCMKGHNRLSTLSFVLTTEPICSVWPLKFHFQVFASCSVPDTCRFERRCERPMTGGTCVTMVTHVTRSAHVHSTVQYVDLRAACMRTR